MKDLLEKFNACQEARNWVGDKTLEEAWSTCHRGDWMFWLYRRMYPDNLREYTLAYGHHLNIIRHLMKNKRSLDAIDATITFTEFNETSLLDALEDAYDTAYVNSVDYKDYKVFKEEHTKATADICRQYLKIV